MSGNADFPATAVGNATSDPELRFTPTGKAVAKFSIAKNVRIPDGNGGWKDGKPEFFDVTVWEALAENVAASVKKGNRVIVKGYWEQQNWETPEGEKRNRVAIVGEDVGLSLRWSTGSVQKAEKSGGSNKSKPAAPDYGPDEEPF